MPILCKSKQFVKGIGHEVLTISVRLQRGEKLLLIGVSGDLQKEITVVKLVTCILNIHVDLYKKHFWYLKVKQKKVVLTTSHSLTDEGVVKILQC